MTLSITINNGETELFENVVELHQPNTQDVEVVQVVNGEKVSLFFPWAIIEDIYEVFDA